MIDVITTAGLESLAPQPESPRRQMIRNVRAVLRRQDATEEEDLDALEALVELSKE